jgi:hypothetical protein
VPGVEPVLYLRQVRPRIAGTRGDAATRPSLFGNAVVGLGELEQLGENAQPGPTTSTTTEMTTPRGIDMSSWSNRIYFRRPGHVAD